MAGTTNTPWLPEGGNIDNWTIDTWRRDAIKTVLFWTAGAMAWLMGLWSRQALAEEVQVASENTQIASMLQNIAFDPEATKIIFANTFPTLKSRAWVYESMFISLDDNEKVFALKVFHSGNNDLTDNNRARLLMSSLSLMETIRNLRSAIETGELDLQKGNDIYQKITTLQKYPGTESVLTPQFIAELDNIYNAMLASLDAKGEELDRQLQLLRALVAPTGKV